MGGEGGWRERATAPGGHGQGERGCVYPRAGRGGEQQTPGESEDSGATAQGTGIV